MKWSALLLLIGYTVGMSVWASSRAAETVCRKIDINVANPSHTAPLTEKGVMEELAKFDSLLVGKKMTLINTKKLEEYLRTTGTFESVECTKSAMGTLRIDVVQMIPVMRVFDNSGRSYYINRQGKEIPSSYEFFNDVMVATGNFSKKFRPMQLLPVVRYIEEHPVLRDLVVMLKADSPDNILLSTKIAGHVVNLGDTTDLDYKFANLLAMYKEVMPQKGWATYDTISLKFKGQIVATRANKTPVMHSMPYEEEEDPEETAFTEYVEGQATTETAEKPAKPTE